eukprot:c20232_g1_i1.p2 GENE.c20232_g1_i1~~c20232_g1_i1.p2  ORF type:complete len:124 (+),score=26.14 c20232_g1_i1:571-942(+)
MHKGAQYLVGTHDFSSFRNAGCQAASPIKTISNIQAVSQREEFSSVILPHTSRDVVEISITADGFLYKMVRNIVGLLYRVGSGRLSADEVPKILEARDRRCVTGCAPAEGLYLVHIQYHPPLF